MSAKRGRKTSLPAWVLALIVVVAFAFYNIPELQEIISPAKYQTDAQGSLVVKLLDVGQGDAILIQNQDSTVLIDAGKNDNSDEFVNELRRLGVEKLDILVGTHPHEDHIGGLDKVIEAFDVETLLLPKTSNNTKTFEDVLDAMSSRDLMATTPKVGDVFDIGDAKLTVVAPINDSYEEMNDYSIVLRLDHGSKSFLFTGDAEKTSEKDMLKSNISLDCDVLKIGHHGSHSSTTDDFLAAVSPEIALISCETGNSYGHPHRETLDILNKNSITTYRTDLSGTVTLSCDGNSISVETEKGA